jgi:hypothetical protein
MTKLIATVVAGLVGMACWFHGHAFCDAILAMTRH